MAPLLVFGAVIGIAGLYVAYVLWPRWPDAPVALDAPSVRSSFQAPSSTSNRRRSA
jgi:hypothetical protein